MKTKEAALKDMRRSLVAGTPAFTYQFMPSGSWSWASAASPIGQVCAESPDGTGVITSSTGKPVAAIYCIEHAVA